MRVDVHQHIWTAPLLDALAGRRELPFVEHSDDVTVLHSAGEQPYVIDVGAEAPRRRTALAHRDRLDHAMVALSSPVGIEALPGDCARRLIEAHLDGVLSLGDPFSAWGPVALDDAEPDDVDLLLRRGCAGISLPAGALADPEKLARYGAVLERAQRLGAPVFVHPGRAPGDRPRLVSPSEPLWWGALTEYVTQMQAAWLTFTAFGRRELPDLVVVFAMLAGGAPLLSERLTTRGGPAVDPRDPGCFYDTSSYGPVAIETMARRVGESQLVYGSDRPVAEPVPSGREAMLQENAAVLLGRTRSPA